MDNYIKDDRNYTPSIWTEFWGPSAWKLMHSIAFTMPDNADVHTQKQYSNFYESLADVLPCPSCRIHFKKHIEKHPIPTDTSDELAQWVYRAHNAVNKRNGKVSPPFSKVKEWYAGGEPAGLDYLNQTKMTRMLASNYFPLTASTSEQLVAGTTEEKILNFLLIILVVIILIVLVHYLYQRYKEKNKSD